MMIREFRESDVPYLYDITSRSLDEPYAPDVFSYFWAQWPAGQMVACGFDGIPAGYIISSRTGNTARITMFAVDPEQRCRGIGTKLLNAFCHKVLMHGIRTITLEVRDTNARAMSFYKRNGFVRSGFLENFYNNGGNAVEMMFSVS